MTNTDPIYISINERPAAILRTMDSLKGQQDVQAAAIGRRSKVPRWLFLAGLPFIALDWLLGYNFLTFTLVAVGLWVAAFWISAGLRRSRPGGPFPPDFATAREVVHTLRDDPDPKRPLFGHVDLTGSQQPAKRFREGKNVRGLAVDFYRDEWLSLKGKLYDGNMLRLSAIQRVKVRKSYWKRSASGKSKLKPAKVGYGQQLKVRLSVNPEVYEITQNPNAVPGARVGKYTLVEIDTTSGIVDVTAQYEAGNVGAADILGVLRVAYDHLARKVSV